MGALPGLFGAGSGAAGTSFNGPGSANIQNPTSPGQVNTAYNNAQNAMGGQQALLSALQGQGGLQNQNQIYGQLQNIASGQGPNPAQAMLAQQTGANVANQAALMAGQRGAGANVGLIARQAAQQGAAAQQQAIGQAATMQAQQSLGALGQAQQLATTQAGQQIGQTNANVSAQQAEQQNLLNAMSNYNAQQVSMQGNINAANAGLAQTQMQGTQGIIGGIMSGGGLLAGSGGSAAGAAAAAARGGEVQGYADGGAAFSSGSGAQSEFGQFLSGSSGVAAPTQTNPMFSAGVSSVSGGAGGAGGTGKIGSNQNQPQPIQQDPNSVSSNASDPTSQPGYVSDYAGANDPIGGTADNPEFAKGGKVHDYRSGGKVNAKVPAQKAVARGNSYHNDKIPAVLSEHEIVLPRSVTLSKDPVRGAAEFVAKVVAKRGKRK